jgi:uncharacterized protein (TIGR02996 family)
MSTEPALLAAVCAAPDDDLPRLVYADWCDENGRPERGEFIRTQIELAKLARDSKRRRRLAFRCRELIDTAEDHLHHLPDTLPPEPWSFRRGFVELLEVEGMHLHTEAVLFGTHPVRRLHAVNYCEIGDLKHIPTDNHLQTFTLTGNAFGTDDVVQLSRTKRFPHLTELGLMGCELGDEAARVLCDRAFFQRLKVLRVGGNPFTDAGRQLLRDHFGDRVSFTCERDAEYLYAFDHTDRFTVGFGKDDTQLFPLAGTNRGWVAVFDHAGNLLSMDERRVRSGSKATGVEARWLAEYGETRATIRVKRFKFPNGVGIEDFPPGWVEELEDPASADRNAAQEWLAYWLDQGKFRWNWNGDDWWLNRDGEVTDT